ncbi:MAG: hypothetical protein Q7K43_04960 [Candidatus Woesearchaeota archaeon]|nr:hypothetical protein [Candidatus Woesearchaeota archaeon]
MKQVPLTFERLEVTQYNPQTEELTLRMVVNDGKQKQLIKQCIVEQAETLATSMIQEVRTKIKTANAEYTNDDSPLAGALMIKHTQDEEMVHEKTAKFLASIRESIRNARSKRISWGDLQKQIIGKKAEYGR